MKTFSEWLLKEIEERQVSYSEISRRGGPSHARISQVISGDKPGLDFCTGLARALRISPQIVFRKAGFLPKAPPQTEGEEAMLYHYRRLDTDQQRMMLTQVRALAEQGPTYEANETD